ncbi:MAG: hypothetical protein DHS20C09_11860 [marine bacterium B5-7]|nr:MAG: hypothetical protein DHS20C09_11860 [marine bacterium B5-7]
MRQHNYYIGKNNQNAQAMVEFVIIIPVLLMLVLGIIQFALVYKAKITLNYATFQTVRAGTLNNASLSAMQTAFASNMAPLYATSYFNSPPTDQKELCTTSFLTTEASRNARTGANRIMNTGLRNVLDNPGAGMDDKWGSDQVFCARRIVQNQIDNGFVNLTVVNPAQPFSFEKFGIDAYYEGSGTIERMIPNDNLMYRDADVIDATHSVQDANLLKVHVGYCYELIIPFINRIVWAMQANTAATTPGAFGPPTTGTFANQCVAAGNAANADRRFGITLYSQGIMRMQSAAVQCEINDSC